MTRAKRRDCLTTGKAAAEIGIHPNTLRWYEEQGRLPKIPRTPGGYRLFSPLLVKQAQIVHSCHSIIWMTGPVRRLTFEILQANREQDWRRAKAAATEIREHLVREQELAEEALELLLRWEEEERTIEAEFVTGEGGMLTIGRAAQLVSVTPDKIRNWERNGLCRLPRAASSGYRLFGGEELELLLVIRYCLRAGYSLTATRRMLRALLPESFGDLHAVNSNVAEEKAEGLQKLKEIADTPHPDETALFFPFPTDTLPRTLGGCIQAIDAVFKMCTELEKLQASN